MKTIRLLVLVPAGLLCACQPQGLQQAGAGESALKEEIEGLTAEIRQLRTGTAELSESLEAAGRERRQLLSEMETVSSEVGRLKELVAELKGQLSASQQRSSAEPAPQGNTGRPSIIKPGTQERRPPPPSQDGVLQRIE